MSSNPADFEQKFSDLIAKSDAPRTRESLAADHTYEHAQGDGSPLARIYDLDGMVLLLGVGYDRNTSFHLADYRSPESPKRKERFAVPEDGRSVWREFDTVEEMNADWLREVGDAFEATGTATIGKVGSAEARLFSQRAAVDFALGWLKSKRAEAAASR